MSVKRFIKTYLRWLLPLMQKIRFAIFRVIGSISPILLAKILFMDAHPGYRLNLKSPKTLADKVNWLKFNTNTEIWSQLADKYLVRDFVVEKGLEETLNPIYGIYDRPEDIDFGLLPNSFVIKTTNGGAGVQVEIIRDKRCDSLIRSIALHILYIINTEKSSITSPPGPIGSSCFNPPKRLPMPAAITISVASLFTKTPLSFYNLNTLLSVYTTTKQKYLHKSKFILHF